MAKENILTPVGLTREVAVPTIPRRKLSLASLAAAWSSDQSEDQVLPLLWPHMYASLGATIGQLGLVLGLSKLVMTLMLPIWGYAADRFSRKKLLVFFTGFWGFLTLGIGLVHSMPQLLVLRVASGLGLGVFAPAAFSLISDLFDHGSRGRAVGALRAVGLVAGLFTIGLLPALAARSPEGWRTGFIVMGLASFFSGLFMLVIEEPARGASEPELRDVITDETASRYIFSWAELRTLLHIRSWRFLLVNDVLTKISFIVWIGWNYTWLTSLGLKGSSFYGVLLFSILGLASGSLFFGWLGDRLERTFLNRGRITMIQAGIILTSLAATAYLLSRGDNLLWLIMFGFLTGFGSGAGSEVALWPVAQAIIPPELRGSNRAIINMVSGAASAILLSLSGVVADRIGVTATLLWFVPLPLLLCAIAWIPMFRTYSRDRLGLHAVLAQRRAELLKQ